MRVAFSGRSPVLRKTRVTAAATRAAARALADGARGARLRPAARERRAHDPRPVWPRAAVGHADLARRHPARTAGTTRATRAARAVSACRGAAGLLTGPLAPVILCEFCDATAAGFGSSGRALYEAFQSFGYALYAMRRTSTGQVQLVPAPPQRHYALENLVAIHV